MSTRRKPRVKKSKYSLSKRLQSSVDELYDKFTKTYQAMMKNNEQQIKKYWETAGEKRPDIDIQELNTNKNELMDVLSEQTYNLKEILCKLVAKKGEFNISIKKLEKLQEDISNRNKYKSYDKLSELINLHPCYLVQKPLNFILPDKRYISFNKACSLIYKLNLAYEKEDVFRVYLYEITNIHRDDYYTPYLKNKKIIGFYKNGIINRQNQVAAKLPNWCTFDKSVDTNLLINIVGNECESIIDKNTKYRVLNYIYKMESLSNEILCEEYWADNDENITNSMINKIISDYELENEISFNAQQKEAITMCFKNKFSIVLGLPGTGKTELVRCVIYGYNKMYEKRKNGLICSLTAPTGAAVKNIKHRCKDLLNDNSISLLGTMHRLCYGIYHRINKQSNSDEEGKYKDLFPDIVVVDEISMADMDIVYKLLVHVKIFSRNHNALPKLIFLGDDNQLASVGYGNVIANLIEAKIDGENVFPITKLNKIMRNDGLIAKAIMKMNSGKKITHPRDFNSSDFTFLDLNKYKNLNLKHPTHSDRRLKELLESLDWDSNRDRLLVGENKTRHKLNEWFQENYLLKNKTEMEKVEMKIHEYTNRIKNNDYLISYYNGSRVVRTKNTTTKTGIYLANGDSGIIYKCTKKNIEKLMCKSKALRQHIDNFQKIEIAPGITEYSISDVITLKGPESEERITINFKNSNKKYIGVVLYDEGEYEFVTRDDIYEEIDLAYAITVYKAQGDEFKNVIVWLECVNFHSSFFFEKLKLFYTAVSRAKQRCIVMGDKHKLSNAQENTKVEKLSWFMNEEWIKESLIEEDESDEESD